MWQQQEKLGELMAHYFKRLPPHEGVPRLIEKALELQRYAPCADRRDGPTLPMDSWSQQLHSTTRACAAYTQLRQQSPTEADVGGERWAKGEDAGVA